MLWTLICGRCCSSHPTQEPYFEIMRFYHHCKFRSLCFKLNYNTKLWAARRLLFISFQNRARNLAILNGMFLTYMHSTRAWLYNDMASVMIYESLRSMAQIAEENIMNNSRFFFKMCFHFLEIEHWPLLEFINTEVLFRTSIIWSAERTIVLMRSVAYMIWLWTYSSLNEHGRRL